MRILVTRPEAEARQFAAALAAIGAEAVVAPFFTIVPAASEPPDLAGIQALLLTSANGARAFAALCPGRDLAVMAVGPATAAAARAAGFVSIASADGDGRDLAALVKRALDPKRGALLHAAGADRAEDFDGELQAAGFEVKRTVLYRAIAADRLPEAAAAALNGAAPDGAPLDGVAFFSPRSARTFVALVGASGLADATRRLTAFCLSPAVAEPLKAAASLPWRAIAVAARPHADSLLDAIRASMNEPAPMPGSSTMIEDAPRTDAPAPNVAPNPTPNDAERIIAAFGGIRPMAKTMGLPVTTVQGWKERAAIPLARMAEIRAAAERAGIDLGALPPAAEAPAAKPETVAAERIGEAPRAGIKAAEAAPPPPPVIEATSERDARAGAARGGGFGAVPFAIGCGAAFLLGMAALAIFGANGGANEADRRALAEAQTRMVALARQVDEQARRLQADAAAVQSRIQRLEGLERAIGEHRDRLANVATTTAALAARLEKLDTDMKSLASSAPAGSNEIRELRESVRQLGQRVEALPRELPDIAAAQRLIAEARQWAERLAALEARLARLGEARPPADAAEIRSALDKQAAELRAEIEKGAAEARAAAERLARALRDELAALDGRVKGLVEDAARRGAGEGGALAVALGQLRRAVAEGAAYRPALNAASALARGRAEFAAPLAALAPGAERGIPPVARLRAEFDKLSVAILRAAAEGELAADADWGDRVWARLKSLVTVRRTGEVAGATPRALVSRAEAALARADLAAAAAAIEALPPAARRPAEAWLAGAKARLAAEAALDALDRLALGLLQGAPAR